MSKLPSDSAGLEARRTRRRRTGIRTRPTRPVADAPDALRRRLARLENQYGGDAA